MRFVGGLLVAGFLVAGLYVFSPFYTAWQIREAVKSNDAEYLVHRIDWPPVRETLKSSLVRFTLGDGAARGASTVAAGTEAGSQAPGFFSRLKARFGRGMVEGIVERYATPTGLKTLFTFGSVARRTGLSAPDPEAGLSLFEKIGEAWSRVRRAEFKSLTRVELDMADRDDPSRLYSGTLEFSPHSAGWRLVELHVLRITALDS